MFDNLKAVFKSTYDTFKGLIAAMSPYSPVGDGTMNIEFGRGSSRKLGVAAALGLISYFGIRDSSNQFRIEETIGACVVVPALIVYAGPPIVKAVCSGAYAAGGKIYELSTSIYGAAPVADAEPARRRRR